MKVSHILFLTLLLIGIGCTPGDENQTVSENVSANGIEIREAWARPAKQGMMGGAYLTIANGTDRADTLLGLSTPVAGIAEIHESYQTETGMGGMRPAGKLPVEARSRLQLSPGGYHIMLMQLDRDLGVGDSIPATIRFAHHDSLFVMIPVKQNPE
ncbi:MAG: copper chaperone PCu(A)C [Balneolaceae bacterium]|nr:copper chaperone PCu(A)C [Balneolaceae bacterium]